MEWSSGATLFPCKQLRVRKKKRIFTLLDPTPTPGILIGVLTGVVLPLRLRAPLLTRRAELGVVGPEPEDAGAVDWEFGLAHMVIPGIGGVGSGATTARLGGLSFCGAIPWAWRNSMKEDVVHEGKTGYLEDEEKSIPIGLYRKMNLTYEDSSPGSQGFADQVVGYCSK